MPDEPPWDPILRATAAGHLGEKRSLPPLIVSWWKSIRMSSGMWRILSFETSKKAVHEIETEAQILLYGSRARGDSIDQSDLNFESSKKTADLRLSSLFFQL
jgi:hypothetical protein